MYTTLAMCVVLHQIVIVLKRKTTKVPVRGCLIRVIEFTGRIIFGQMACVYYMVTFMSPSPLMYSFFAVCIFSISAFIILREWGGVKKSFVEASNAIQDKIDNNKKPKQYEMLLMNLVSFGVISNSYSYYKARLSRKERSEYAAKRDVEMKKRRTQTALHDSDDDEEE